MLPRRAYFAGILALPALRAARAQPSAAGEPRPLSPAQIALFETPHLAAIREPVKLDYAFRREEEGKPAVEDRITMDIRAVHPNGRHDVYPEFLTGERRIAYPPAMGFLGNPLLMFALDRDTRELAAATGGTPMWFRSRIRQSFAEGAVLRQTSLRPAGAAAAAPATEIEITPFQGEPRARRYQQRRYLFLLCDAVPGAVAETRTMLPAGDGGGAVVETISFAGTRA